MKEVKFAYAAANWVCFFKMVSVRHRFTQRGLGLRPWPQPKD